MRKTKPIRMCVGCGRKRPKGEVIRLVCENNGRIRVDPAGKSPGRGVYVCTQISCVRKAQKRGALPVCEDLEAFIGRLGKADG